jgi:CHASE2 domain-containing sensor protein
MGKGKKANRSIVWLVPLVVTPYLIIGGLWSLSQPWGEMWQKILVILFLSVLCLIAIFYENERRLKFVGIKRKRRLELILALGSALFSIGGAIIAISYQWVIGLAASATFGSISAILASYYRKNNNQPIQIQSQSFNSKSSHRHHI